MRLTRLLFVFIICFFPFLTIAKNKIVYFEPKFVILEGIVKTLKFPGPPNYESIENGDADETGAYLILDHPIDINLVKKVQIGNDTPEKNVKLLQLVVFNDKDWEKIKEGNHVQIVGTLFSALTGHHHARVLLTVRRIKMLSKQKIVDSKLDITAEDRQFLKYQYLQN